VDQLMDQLCDLSMNESPFPPLERISQAVAERASALNRYPDNRVAALTGALAEWLGVPAESVLVGPGSAGLLQHLAQSLGPKPEIVHAQLCFEGYPLIVRNAGARGVEVPLDGYRHDLPAMAKAVTEDTRCVFVCNPNNPTGTAVDRAALEEFLDAIPDDVPVIVDEAYRDFAVGPDQPDALELFRARSNVSVLRTFSKAYGLAALRVGYAVVPAPLAPAARMAGAVFFPNALAQTAALACMEPEVVAEVARRSAAVVAERERLRAGLTAAGLTVAPSRANFLWLPLGAAAAGFAEQARRAGFLVMAVPGVGVRVTVGTPEVDDRFCAFAAAQAAEVTRREP
jgi:histidinol-phosphate aminotransferase